MNKKSVGISVLAALAAGAGAYAIYRFTRPARARAAVRRKLPIARDLPTIADDEGNYDLDGVSFDIEGVIISGDKVKSTHLM